MRINRVLVLAIILVSISYAQARAEDCVYSYDCSWGYDTTHMDGVAIHQDCYSDSSHSIKTSEKTYQIALFKNDGWSASTGSDGKPIITNNSGVSYSLEIAPMYETYVMTYDASRNGDLTSINDIVYDEQGRITVEYKSYYNASIGDWTNDYKYYEYNADGSYVTYDEDGNLIGKYNADGSQKVGKRIYTVEEARRPLAEKEKILSL